jgi:hypothetical protein
VKIEFVTVSLFLWEDKIVAIMASASSSLHLQNEREESFFVEVTFNKKREPSVCCIQQTLIQVFV